MTVSNVVKALHAVADQWIKISNMLEVPDIIVNSILVSRLQDDEVSLRTVIEWWFKNSPNPEWNIIHVCKFATNIPLIHLWCVVFQAIQSEIEVEFKGKRVTGVKRPLPKTVVGSDFIAGGDEPGELSRGKGITVSG